MKYNILLLFFSLMVLLTGCTEQKWVPPSHQKYFRIETKMADQQVVDGKVEGNLEIVFGLLTDDPRMMTLDVKMMDISDNETERVLFNSQIYRGKLTKNNVQRIIFPVKGLGTGKYKAFIQALSEENEQGRLGGLRIILFTINKNNIRILKQTDIP